MVDVAWSGVDVDEVPGLGPVALNGKVVVRPRLIAEETDDAAVVAAALSGAVGVEYGYPESIRPRAPSVQYGTNRGYIDSARTAQAAA